MEAVGVGLMGAIGGFILGKNWKRIKKGLADICDRLKEEASLLDNDGLYASDAIGGGCFYLGKPDGGGNERA